MPNYRVLKLEPTSNIRHPILIYVCFNCQISRIGKICPIVIPEEKLKAEKTPSLVVVGAGFFGATIAYEFSRKFKKHVLVLDKRNHLGGNAYSYRDAETGIEIHKYGTHLFHTSNDVVWEFVNRLGDFNDYQHKVWSVFGSEVFSMPVNLDTISQIYKKTFSPEEAKRAIANDIASSGLGTGLDTEANFENKAISLVGPKIYKALIEGYTKKQWQTPPSQLPAEIITRLPLRFDFNNRYFSDKYEGLPKMGYGELFKGMLSDPYIDVQLETDFFDSRWVGQSEIPVVYTGAIDRYFNYKFGRLKWRTIDFEMERIPVADAQGCAVMNYADESVPYTRIHEFRHLHPEREMSNGTTIIAREYSRWAEAEDEPYYPVNSIDDRQKLNDYRTLAKQERNIFFGGRLGTYQYLDMHMAIASALVMFENKIAPLFLE